MTQDDVNIFLWFAGFDPVADYGISVYDIHYESHSEYGTVDTWLLYTYDAADDPFRVDLGGSLTPSKSSSAVP